MTKKQYLDFNFVHRLHAEIHEYLENWARYVCLNGSKAWQTHPMWKQYRSNAWQWHKPEIHNPVNQQQAIEIEKIVISLPEKHRNAIKWCYIVKNNPSGMAKCLQVTVEELFELIQQSRAMIKNKKSIANIKSI